MMQQRRKPILAKDLPLNTGYRHTRLNLDEFHAGTQWVVIKEDKNRSIPGVYVPDAKAVTTGYIMSAGQEAIDAGINVGDKVIYEEWMGGRWAFTTYEDRGTYVVPEEIECLIMSMDHVWVVIR